MASGSCQRGFTYLYALLLVAVSGAAMVSFAAAWSSTREREKLAELRWVGNQFRQAIGLYYERSPGSVKRFPEKLEDLLEDRRFLTTQRYLRRIYTDPLTGKADWELLPAPTGGFSGVRSRRGDGADFVYQPQTSAGLTGTANGPRL
jgi:type II secretory pathway pseudopilin PulG